MANFSPKLRASVSVGLRLMLEMLLTRSALPKFFQRLFLHKDMNLDLSLETWLLFIVDISGLSWLAVLWDIPCFRLSSSPKSLALSNVFISENFNSWTEDTRYEQILPSVIQYLNWDQILYELIHLICSFLNSFSYFWNHPIQSFFL